MLLSAFLALVPQVPAAAPRAPQDSELQAAGRLAGLQFTPEELKQLRDVYDEGVAAFARLRLEPLPNDLPPALEFQPLLPGVALRPPRLELQPIALPAAKRPARLEDLAWASVPELAALLRARAVTSVELTQACLARLKRLDPRLHIVVHLLEERALATARARDAEIAEGRWRGLLHGIPYGAKDLFAARGAPTTWGSAIFAEQVFDEDAAVVKCLEDAGAVLVAKLACGELAYGDLWFGGMSRNPWAPDLGSSGSSGGSASAVAAGCVPFALGTETLGSIVSPALVCGATGLRPSFGRVSRKGCMALAWSMDKVGLLARSAADAALVFAAIEGPSPADPAPRAARFAPGRAKDLKGVRIGVPTGAFEGEKEHAHVLDELIALGAELHAVDLPDVRARDLLVMLNCEAATAFDELTRSGADDRMVWQAEEAWPNTFRAAQLVPAVEYLRAARLRTRVMREMAAVMSGVDVIVHPTWATTGLTVSNLTGHPAVALPDGFDAKGLPLGITFCGQLDGEQDLVAIAAAWQESTAFHRRHPDLDAPK